MTRFQAGLHIDIALRTVCTLCGKTFRSVGVHVWRAHGILAREYKRSLGLRLDVGLCCDETKALQRESGLVNNPAEEMRAMKALADVAPRGPHPAQHNMGAPQRATLAAKNRMFFDRTCRVCHAAFVGRSGRTLCDGCRDAIAVKRAQPRP